MSGNLQAALDWAARGFRVFPLRPGSKKPLIDEWDWTQGATGEPAQIAEWWRQQPAANVGVLTDGHIVCDLDVKGGRDGIESFKAKGLPQDTLVVRTPSGGLHVYYSGPNRANSVDRIGNGIDIRSYHGYVIAPGSWLDPSQPSNKGVGGVYSLIVDLPIRSAPESLIAALDAPSERQNEGRPVVELDQADAVARATAYAASVDAPVFGQGADAYTFNVACALKDMGVSADTAAAILREYYLPRCMAPRSPDEQLAWIDRKVENAFAYGKNAPGSASAHVDFGGVKIEAPAVEPRAPTNWFHHGDEWDRDVTWLFYETLPTTGVAVLTGPSQGGKTFVGLELARCLATGREFFTVDPEERGGTLLLFAGTEGGGLAKRLAALEEPERLPIAACNVGILGEQGAMQALLESVQAKKAEMLAEFGVPVRLIILETLSASGLILDENDNAQAAMAMTALATLSRFTGCLVLVTHHPPKDGKGERGAGAIRNSADYVMEIHRNGKEVVRDIELTKARDAGQRKLGSFSLLPVKLGVDSRGRDVISMAVSSGAPAIRQDKATVFGELVVECLEWALIERGELIDGHMAVEVERVEDVFRDRKPGGRDGMTIKKAWGASFEWAETAGAVITFPYSGRRYVRSGKIEV